MGHSSSMPLLLFIYYFLYCLFWLFGVVYYVTVHFAVCCPPKYLNKDLFVDEFSQ